MIQIVMKPVPGQGVVNRESLYAALFNGEDIGMQVRALRASHAEQKVMEMFRHSIDKVGGRLLVDYNKYCETGVSEEAKASQAKYVEERGKAFAAYEAEVKAGIEWHWPNEDAVRSKLAEIREEWEMEL